MIRLLVLFASSACVCLFAGFETAAAQFKFPNQTFTVPEGFEVELISDPSLVQRPVSASFDEAGRLYVTDSSGSNDKPAEQLKEKPHRIMRLEPAKAEGKFTKSIVFADKIMFPEGCLWFNGSLYVAAPPTIWKLTDTNQDGVADLREEWHEGKTLTGCANDLHGPYLGLDGWIYWCKGAFAEQRYTLPNGKSFVSRAAHIFRARPDHSGLEPVMTGGMDNPVGLAFTAEGERILCGTFFAPDEPGHRDGLIHAIYGGVYGKRNNVNDDHKQTGELMPVMTHMGPAAPCSVIRYESRVFGPEYQDNLFVCAFNMHKITRHILEPEGATFKTRDSDFLVSDNPDFHPTDVIEDADGSLVVLDTGPWYKLCCPTSQLNKPDLLGAIYRVRKTGAEKLDDPRGLNIAWNKSSPEQLAALLGDERVFVQRRAMQELAKHGEAAVPALQKIIMFAARAADAKQAKQLEGNHKTEWPKGPAERTKAVWTLTQIDSLAARGSISLASGDPDSMVRCAVLQSASLLRDRQVLEASMEAHKAFEADSKRSPSPISLMEERLWFELLGRTGSFHGIPELAVSDTIADHFLPRVDRTLQHSFTYALIESEGVKTARSLLETAKPQLRPAALIALDQMDNGGLQAATVAPLLASNDADLRKAAVWVAGHHPDWGDALADFFKARLNAKDLASSDLEELGRQLTQFAHSAGIQKLMAATLTDHAMSDAVKQLVLQAMAAAGLKEPPEEWTEAVRSTLGSSEEKLVRAAISAARALSQTKTNAPNLLESLLGIGRDEKRAADLRLEALAALPNGLRSVEPDLFEFLCANVDPSKPVAQRSEASTVLAKAKLKREQLSALTGTMKLAGPLELTKLLTAFERSTNEGVGLKLIASLKEAKGVSSLRPDLIKAVTAKYPASVQQQAQGLIILLDADNAKQAAHIDELLPSLKEGDIRRGQLIFNSQKAACFSCHSMGYMGGKVGPDLTSIGQVRTERDLLESIVYPSASFVRSYEPYFVSTKGGDSYAGVLKKDAADEVVLATGPGTEARINRADIIEMRPGTVSIMPAGLDQQLSKQELADLVAFLKSTKWGPH
jgi:putative membrane-bound dehydrogenase-like protein